MKCKWYRSYDVNDTGYHEFGESLKKSWFLAKHQIEESEILSTELWFSKDVTM